MIFLNIHLPGLLAAFPYFIEDVAPSPPRGLDALCTETDELSWCLLVWSLCPGPLEEIQPADLTGRKTLVYLWPVRNLL